MEQYKQIQTGKPELIPVALVNQPGIRVVLHNSSIGYQAVIDCLYLLPGKYDTLRQANKVAKAINRTPQVMRSGYTLSGFRAEVISGEYPVGAKVIGTPLRVATCDAVSEWVEKYLPDPISASDYDDEAQISRLIKDFSLLGYQKNPILSGEQPCAVA